MYVYPWNAFDVNTKNPTTVIKLKQIGDIVLPGEFFMLDHPLMYNSINYGICKIVRYEPPLIFIQLACSPGGIINVPKLETPINRNYIYYPREIIITNLGCYIRKDQLKSVVIPVSKYEIEDSVIGSLASVNNVFLLRFQYDHITSTLSSETNICTFSTTEHDSYTQRVINLLIKIIDAIKQALNCRALNRPYNITSTIALSWHEWIYIKTQLTIPVETINSLQSKVISRDQALQERMKNRSGTQFIIIDSDEKLQMFKNVFGEHSLIGYTVRPPPASKSLMTKQDNGLFYSTRPIHEGEWINCINDLSNGLDIPDNEVLSRSHRNRGITLIYNSLYRKLSIELRYKKVHASQSGLLGSLQLVYHPRHDDQVLEVDTHYHDGSIAYRIVEINDDQIRSQIVEVEGTLVESDALVTHDREMVLSLLRDFI
jgi:hypothetical protein